jgi:hypothetical protein
VASGTISSEYSRVERGWVPGVMGEASEVGEAAYCHPPTSIPQGYCPWVWARVWASLLEAADLFFLGIFLLFCSLLLK